MGSGSLTPVVWPRRPDYLGPGDFAPLLPNTHPPERPFFFLPDPFTTNQHAPTPRIICCTTRTHHGIRRIQLAPPALQLSGSPRCGEEFETDPVRKSCGLYVGTQQKIEGKASTNLTSPSESPQLTTPQHHDHNRWLPNYCQPNVKASCNRQKIHTKAKFHVSDDTVWPHLSRCGIVTGRSRV
jgi:hypothetical protein